MWKMRSAWGFRKARRGSIFNRARCSGSSCADPGVEQEISGSPFRVNTSNCPTPVANLFCDTVDNNSGGAAYPTTDATGVLNFAPVTVANLPATCTPGDGKVVQDWNGTVGACNGGGSDYTHATCGGSNTWYCP
jgi:hypothetical protein